MFATGIAVVTFLLIVPGFFSLQVVEALAPIRKEPYKNKLISAFGLSLINYLLYMWVSAIPWLGIKPLMLDLWGNSIPLDANLRVPLYNVDNASLIAILMISVLLGAFIAWILNQGWFFRALNKAKLSYSTGRESVWHDVFRITHGSWVKVYMKDNTIVQGHLSHYSDDPKNPMLYLSRVEGGRGTIQEDQRVNITRPGETESEWIEGPGVLLVTPDIQYIEFLDGKE